ncbi:hypothetical protein SAMN04488483_0822 [Pseudomonas helmanticensis]|uniref:Uncharacterized protein n=1 Tax=Pseudomonas helmanticensis TaxID=1471381 RepID=A0ACD2U173_9PSED|nr:hypothetical protein [Pseudomonas helmanticensis]SMQ23187.1 hypothetical protein SAMN04488483_0822 [Pseudomonas helmanticensis]
MIQISAKQYEALTLASDLRLSEDMEQHVYAHLPSYAEEHGRAGVKQIVQAAIARSRQWQLSRRATFQMLNLLCLYGNEFESDAQCQWLVDVLNDEAFGDMSARMNMAQSEALGKLAIDQEES